MTRELKDNCLIAVDSSTFSSLAQRVIAFARFFGNLIVLIVDIVQLSSLSCLRALSEAKYSSELMKALILPGYWRVSLKEFAVRHVLGPFV